MSSNRGSSEIFIFNPGQTLDELIIWRPLKEIAFVDLLKKRAKAERILFPYGLHFWSQLNEKRKKQEKIPLIFEKECQSSLEKEKEIQKWAECFWEKAEEILFEEQYSSDSLEVLQKKLENLLYSYQSHVK